MSETTIRIEWGWWSFYADLSSENLKRSYDGSLDVRDGEVTSVQKFNYWGLYGPSRETRQPLSGTAWKSAIRPGDNKGLEGIVFAVKGSGRTKIRLNFKEIKPIAFSLSRLAREKKFRVHLGPKYSCADVAISLDGYDEFLVTGEELARESKKDGLMRVLLESADFRPADRYDDFERVRSAWIAPGQEATAVFRLARKTQHTCRVLIKALVVDPAQGDRIDWVTWDAGVRTYLNYQVFLNQSLVRKDRHFFSSFRACQKLEELNFEIAPDLLRAGTNTISIRNDDHNICLLINRVFLSEETAAVWNRTGRWPEHPAVMAGVDLNVASPENGEIDALLKYLCSEKIANYVLFRTERHRVLPDDWRRWFTFCRRSRLFFAVDPEGDIPPDKGKIPGWKQVIEMAAEFGRQYFLGVHHHEQSNLIYGWGSKEPWPERRNRTMLKARDAYLAHLRKIFAVLPDGVNRILGEAIPVQYHDYQAGVDICQSETMTGHTVLLLASGRGAAKAARKKIWGAHVACHVHHYPEDLESQRMFRLNLYLAYLYGARIIYDEETALMMFHGRRYSFSDKLPRQRRMMLQEFHRWCGANPLSGKPQVNIGILQGNGGVFTGGLNIGAEPVKVWGDLGPETREWEYLDPEYGWRYLDIFLPGVRLAPIRQDPRKVRHWFSGTPYGQVDLVPVESAVESLHDYRLLILLGWNTMTDEIYEKLKEYVAAGGKLFLSRSHLTTQADRKFLLNHRPAKLLRDGDFRDLFGVTIGRKIECATARVVSAGSAGEGPLLVENSCGRGQAYLLTAPDYPGRELLVPLVSGFLKKLARQARTEPLVRDSSREVNSFVFRSGNVSRLYLVNTDWTAAGNIKRVKVGWAGKTRPVDVKEGLVSSLALKQEGSA